MLKFAGIKKFDWFLTYSSANSFVDAMNLWSVVGIGFKKKTFPEWSFFSFWMA